MARFGAPSAMNSCEVDWLTGYAQPHPRAGRGASAGTGRQDLDVERHVWRQVAGL